MNGNAAGADTCVLKLTGENTYTGGTWVVRSTLALGGSCSAGTGAVVLDGATLRFDNDSDVDFMSRIEGAGTIKLAGRGRLALAELESQDGEGFVLDVGTRVAKIGSLDGIKEIVSSLNNKVSLIVADGNVDFGGNKASNVSLYTPDTYKAPGFGIIVR